MKKPLIIFLLLFALRLIFDYFVGPIDDETYHWLWSQHLQISYFDHPGMIAWMDAFFTGLFGNSIFAIRLSALTCFAGTNYFLYKITKGLFDEKTAWTVLILMFFLPLYGIAGFSATPDLPLILFWTMALYFFYQSIREDGNAWSVKKSWLLIGLAMGLGMNSKFTICLLGLGMGLYLLVTPGQRKHLLTPWPYLAALMTFVMMTPVFIWNQQHGWPSFIYQFYRRHQSDGVNWGRWFGFWGIQWGFLSPGIYYLLLLTTVACFARWKDYRWRLLICLALPSILIFYTQPLTSDYKPHWVGPAHLILFIGVCALWWGGFTLGKVNLLKPRSKVAAGISIAFLVLINFIAYMPLLSPHFAPKVFAMFSKEEWKPSFDFTNEFFGWPELGLKVNEMQDELQKQTGRPVFVASHRYELVSQVAYATKRPVLKIGTEVDQFLFDQPIAERNKHIHENGLLIGTDKYKNPEDIDRYFARCTKNEFKTYRGDVLSRIFQIWYCEDFKGEL